jgi:hypothetical protein
MLFRGSTRIEKIFRGSTPIGKIYRGSTLVYTSTPPMNFMEMIQDAGAASGVQLCLDAAALESYNPASDAQRWKDLSGNGNHFFRGSAVGSGSDDPSFQGTAGDLSGAEYFQTDGNDYFWSEGTPNYSADDHKDNAAFTILGVTKPIADNPANVNFVDTDHSSWVSSLATQGWSTKRGQGMFSLCPLFSNHRTRTSDAKGRGMLVTFCKEANKDTSTISNDLTLRTIVHNTTSKFTYDDCMLDEVLAVSSSRWGSFNFFAVAIDESVGANGLTLQINDTRAKRTSTYSGPTSGDGIQLPCMIGEMPVGGSGIRPKAMNGCQYALLAYFDGRLSDTQIDGIYARVKTQRPEFGLP